MKYCTLCKEKFEDGLSFCPTDGEVLEDDPSSLVDTVLDGQYRIESLLGKGGMGAVYLGRHILLGDRVAIKILPREVQNNAEWLRRFRREGQAARRFRHANAVTVYDLRTAADGTIYMVMEYVEGHTLDAELKQRGRFTPADALEVLEPIMSVLNTAHAMGVVHRDLKPENIMIGKGNGSESTVKLLDLGIAKMREIAGVESSGTTELTMAGQVLGTPYYMSPEQWGELSRDGNMEIDGRADIYSLGLVAYQMIAGRRVYAANTLHELRREHLYAKPPALSEVVPGVSPAFSKVIDRAISKDRVDRQSTAGELAEELRAALRATVPALEGRTLAIPRDEGSSAHTRSAGDAVNTQSDLNAATLLTDEAVVTSPPNAGTPPGVAIPAAQPHLAGGADLSSSMTVQQQPRRPPAVASSPAVAAASAPPKSRGKSVALVAAVVFILLIGVVGVGGFLAYKFLKGDGGEVVANGNSGTTGTTGNTGATNTPSEFGRYWLEVLPPGLVAEPTRVAGGAVPLTSGQAFKFHFQLEQDGYLYIVGPGQNSKPTAFLTEKPAAISGLENNQVSKDTDFSFPDGIEKWLELDKKAGTEDYTIIFSPVKLSSPAFFTEQATGKPLSETERSEFEAFVAEKKTVEPITELNDKNASAPFVAIKLPGKIPGARDSGSPVIFGVRIQHK
ncbi:MAG TPA: protein kinase [Pyrinomonadaceae bacterium]|nr:protein kinase [Pyrinomonadaceae bacterium]